jgi:FkbM family methyltransferase
LAFLLRLLTMLGCSGQAATVAYRTRARLLARDRRGHIRRWGVSFDLNLNDNVQRSFYYTGWYERPFLEFLREELRADDTYIDVGAHVGIDAAFAAQHASAGSVVAFEPSPDTVARLRDSFGQRDNVEVVPVALGDAAGTVTLHANTKWHPEDAATRSRYADGPEVCEATVVRFDDWGQHVNRMDVVKIDVEGDELNVLKGMSGSLARMQPRVVAVEIYEPHLAAAGVAEADIVNLLDELGYARERKIGDNVIFRLRGTEPAPGRERAHARTWSLRPALYAAAASLVLAAWLIKAVATEHYNVFWRPADLGWGGWALLFPAGVVVAWFLSLGLLAVRRGDGARAIAGFVPDCLVLIGRLMRDDRVQRRRKLLLLLLLGYLAMPLDPLPDFIPVVGQLDDVLLMTFVFRRFLRGGGELLVRQHWPGPESSLRVVLRLAGA